MNTLERHPQRQQIIDAILAGTPLRNIAATVDPPLHYSTLSRFRSTLVSSVASRIHARGESAKAIKTMADGATTYARGVSNQSDTDKGESNREEIRALLQRATAKLESRFESWIKNAEEPAEDGQLHHSALSLHSRNALNAIELRAKLAGLLQDVAGVANNVAMAVLVVPTIAPSKDDDQAAGPTIDLMPVEDQ